TFGDSIFSISLATELTLGLLMGLLGKLRKDNDYGAWRHLKSVSKKRSRFHAQTTELLGGIEIAKNKCAAGIRRAQNSKSRRRPPFHKPIALFTVSLAFLASAATAQQPINSEVILIDTSTSIAKSNATGSPFQ